MKKFTFRLAATAGTAFLFLSLTAFPQEILFETDFSDPGPNGEPASAVWGPPGVRNATENNWIRITEANSEHYFGTAGNPYLHFHKRDTGSALFLTAVNRFAAAAPVVTVRFDFHKPSQTTWGASNGAGPRVRLGINDPVAANNARTRQDNLFGTGGAFAGSSAVFSPNTRHTIQIVYNNSSQTVADYHGNFSVAPDSYDVWVDGQRVLSDHQNNTHEPALSLDTALTSIGIGAFANEVCEFFMDNLVVRAGAWIEATGDPDPEPPPPVEDGDFFKIFLSPDGREQNSGLSPEDPVLSLTRAQQILAGRSPAQDVKIVIGPGRYHGQTVVWSYVRPAHRIRFAPAPGDEGRVIFDGRLPDGSAPGGTWFRLNHSNGNNTNLEFLHLRIEYYETAISLNGNRNNINGYNANNRVEGCYFYRIGNLFNPSLSPSTAVIRFVNSKDNIIHNNDFIDVVNTTGGGLIHAIYAAHLADMNVISRNRFINHSGDPVRVRDFSNANYISDNVHILAGTDGYSEWYCDNDVREDCTKPTPECPSWFNEYRNNYLVSRYGGGTLGTFRFHQSDSTSGCEKPSPDAVRLRTSGNVRTTFSNWDLWIHRNFTRSERDEGELTRPNAVPRADDGLPNVLRHAFGIERNHRAGPNDLPRLRRTENGSMELLWLENPDADTTVIVEHSTDLIHWTPAAWPVDDVPGEHGWGRIGRSASLSGDLAETLFTRVRAVLE